MSRVAARIRQDEVARMIRAAQSCGLHVKGVEFDGGKVAVMTGESGEKVPEPVDGGEDGDAPEEVETI
jgi:hypothetical protein